MTEGFVIPSKRTMQSGRKEVKKDTSSSSTAEALSKRTKTNCLTPQLWRARIPEVYSVTRSQCPQLQRS